MANNPSSNSRDPEQDSKAHLKPRVQELAVPCVPEQSEFLRQAWCGPDAVTTIRAEELVGLAEAAHLALVERRMERLSHPVPWLRETANDEWHELLEMAPACNVVLEEAGNPSLTLVCKLMLYSRNWRLWLRCVDHSDLLQLVGLFVQQAFGSFVRFLDENDATELLVYEQIPAVTPENRNLWVAANDLVEQERLDGGLKTLKESRLTAARWTAPDGKCGIDGEGRLWRRVGLPRYWPGSLKRCPISLAEWMQAIADASDSSADFDRLRQLEDPRLPDALFDLADDNVIGQELTEAVRQRALDIEAGQAVRECEKRTGEPAHPALKSFHQQLAAIRNTGGLSERMQRLARQQTEQDEEDWVRRAIDEAHGLPPWDREREPLPVDSGLAISFGPPPDGVEVRSSVDADTLEALKEKRARDKQMKLRLGIRTSNSPVTGKAKKTPQPEHQEGERLRVQDSNTSSPGDSD